MAIDLPRTPSRYLVLLRNALRVQGVDTHRLLALAGIEEARFNRRDTGLSPAEIAGFVRAAHQLTGRADLGFELGRLIKMTSHDMLGYGMLSCATLDETFTLTARHFHLMTKAFDLRYDRRPGGAGVAQYTPRVSWPPDVLQFFLEMVAITNQSQMRQILGPDMPGYDIYLSMPEPAHIQRYFALAPMRFHFDAHDRPGVRLVMGSDVLDAPLPFGNKQVVQQVDESCGLLGQLPGAGEVDWVDYAIRVLRQAGGNRITLVDLARRAHVSPRTIDRHLKKADVSFQELCDKIRFEQACALLRRPGVSIQQVALTLGFGHTENFSRAFRRVVGVAPSQYLRIGTVPTGQTGISTLETP